MIEKTTPTYQYSDTLSPQIQRAIEYYIDSRDITRAAVMIGMDGKDLAEVFRRPAVKAEIDRKLDIEDRALAEIRAKARVLTPDKLDEKLVDVLNETSEKSLPNRVKALEIGYKRFGMLKEKTETALTGGNGQPLTFALVRLGKKGEGPNDSGSV